MDNVKETLSLSLENNIGRHGGRVDKEFSGTLIRTGLP